MSGSNGSRPTARIEKITPSRAEEYLKANTHNRPKKSNKVDLYRGAMERGEWQLTGEAIKFAKSGRVLDGQNRLWAVALSGVTIESFVIRDLDDAAQDVMDAGATRSFSDALALRGEPSATILAAACRYLWLYETTGDLAGGGRRSPTTPQLLDYLERNPDVRRYVSHGRSLRLGIGGSGSVWAAVFYLFSQVDQEDADVFAFQVKTGAELAPRSPALALRSAVINYIRRRETRGGLPVRLQAAWAIKSFNAFREGRPMNSVVWKPSTESFPEIKTNEEIGV